MNRHISQEKKAEVAKAFKIFLKVDEPAPTDFRGVSPLNNENSMFFGFKDGKTAEDINNLWTLYLGLFGKNDKVAELFNQMTQHQYGIKFNLTMGMYWVCPTKYFPLDGPSRKYLNARGVAVSEKVPTYDEFVKISEEVREKLCGGSNTDKGLIADALHTQIEMHRLYGGVVPELASRDHIRRIIPLLNEVMKKAGKTPQDLDAVAVTEGPGLAGALLVGNSVAYGIGLALDIPVVGIHHLEGHLLSSLLADDKPSFPFIALLVSGGHTQIMEVRALGDYELLGETLDDAAGEAFDKTAQALGYSYPGGPAVSALAEKGTPGAIELPRPLIHAPNLDFSFSGLKTAVMNTVRKEPKPLSQEFKNNLARAFVDSVTDVLVTKCLKALKKTGNKSLVAAGGVSANKQLRTRLTEACRRRGVKVFFPPQALCTDNGAMIAAAAGAHLAEIKDLKNKKPDGFSIKPRWSLEHPNDND